MNQIPFPQVILSINSYLISIKDRNLGLIENNHTPEILNPKSNDVNDFLSTRKCPAQNENSNHFKTFNEDLPELTKEFYNRPACVNISTINLQKSLNLSEYSDLEVKNPSKLLVTKISENDLSLEYKKSNTPIQANSSRKSPKSRMNKFKEFQNSSICTTPIIFNKNRFLRPFSTPARIPSSPKINAENDDPIYLSKFPGAHEPSSEQPERIKNLNYENLIFDCDLNDYISVIRRSKHPPTFKKNSFSEFDKTHKIHKKQSPISSENDKKPNIVSAKTDPVYLSKFSGACKTDLEESTNLEYEGFESTKNEKNLKFFRDPNNNIKYSPDNLPNRFRSKSVSGKFKYENFIFESESNDYVSMIRNNINPKHKKSDSIKDFDVLTETRNNYPKSDLDPWRASRTPNADFEPAKKTRFKSPLNASASRFCRNKCMASLSSSTGLGSYNTQSLHQSSGECHKYESFTHLKNHQFSSQSELISLNRLNNKKLQSSESINQSPISFRNTFGVKRLKPGYGLSGSSFRPKMTSAYISMLRNNNSFVNHQENLYGVTSPESVFKDLKKYPYEVVRISPKKSLPINIDRQNLERHLNGQEFEEIFGMSYEEFISLPYWKRTEMKKLLKLF